MLVASNESTRDARFVDELALLRHWRDGDERAGNELFVRCFWFVYRFFVNKTRTRDDTDDLAQTTFVNLFEAIDRYRGGSFRTFALGIASNLLKHYYRDLRRDERLYDLLTTSIVDLGAGVQTQLECAEVQAVFIAALRAIPADYQLALELHYVDDLDVAEIGATLDLVENTVRSRLARARDTLRIKVRELADKSATELPPEDEWARTIKSAFPTQMLAGTLRRR